MPLQDLHLPQPLPSLAHPRRLLLLAPKHTKVDFSLPCAGSSRGRKNSHRREVVKLASRSKVDGLDLDFLRGGALVRVGLDHGAVGGEGGGGEGDEGEFRDARLGGGGSRG